MHPPTWLSPLIARFRATPEACVAAATLVGSAGVAALAMLARDPLPPGGVYLLFVPVMIGASFFGGVRPGLLATLLGGAVAARLSGSVDANFFLFVGVGVLTAVSGEWVTRVRARGERALQGLSEREAHLRSIFDVAPDALIVIDEKGVMQSYSLAAQRMFGWSADEALGANISMLMPAPFRGEHDGYLVRYLETGQARIIGVGRIVIGERKDGSTFPIELSVGEVLSPRGRFFTGFIRDLTERQKTEARLQELQSELVHISRLSAMGEMASTLAHELNQPLSAIANYLGGARRLVEQAAPVDSRVVEALAKGGEQAVRAGDIIRRLRDFLARGESERRVESLQRLVREACTLALVGAEERRVRVRYGLDPRIDQVLVDRVQVQQVILNLVRNALDAMSDSEGRRELSIESTPAVEVGMAMVSVVDSGPGLDPSVAPRLFQPFVTSKLSGMGVGLSISRTIVEAHGGRIWCEPNPEGGAAFRFTVPMAQAAFESEA